MTRRRRIVLVVFAVILALTATTVVVFHSPGVQREIWMAVTEAIEEGSGIHIEAEHFKLRGLPARLVIRGLKVDMDGRTVLTADDIRAGWEWRRLMAQPRRIEYIVVSAPVLFGDALPPPGEELESAPETDIWGFEIGSLEISGGRASAGVPEIHAMLEGISLHGALEDGAARAAMEADLLSLDRSGRELVFGPLALEMDASPDGVAIRGLKIEGDAARLTTSGRLTPSPEMAGRFETEIEVEVPTVAAWWDPNLVTGLVPEGRAVLVGEIEMLTDGKVTAHFEHRGTPMALAGYDLDTLVLTYVDGLSTVRVAGSGWGRADVTIDESGVTSVSADLDGAPVDRLLAFAAPQISNAVRGPTVVSGRIDGKFSFPVDPGTLEGDVDLVIRSADGRIVVEGHGVGTDWQFERLEAQVGGVAVQAHGGIGPGGTVRAEAELMIADPALAAETFEPLYPDIGPFEIGGGPISGTVRIDGELPAPEVEGYLTWSQPEVLGRRLGEISAHGVGDMDEVRWRIGVEIDGDSTLRATGTALPLERVISGDWEIEISDLVRAAEVLAPGADFPSTGRFAGSGSLEWSVDGYRVDGRVDGWEAETDLFTVPRLETEFVVEPGVAAIENLRVEVFDGVIEGRMRVPWTDLDGQIDGRLSWREIDVTALPTEVLEGLSGLVSGEADFSGTMSRPEGKISVVWEAARAHPVADRLQLRVDMVDGVVRATIEDTTTRAGVIGAVGEMPLGGIERPSWLWPGAPGGPAIGHVEANGFSFGPIAEMFGIDTQGVDGYADLEADVEWNPQTSEFPKIVASAHDLRVVHPAGELAADGPVEVRIDGRKIHIEPVALVGFNSRIEVEASYDQAENGVDGLVNAVVSEELARLLPMPVSVRGFLRADAEFHIPVSGHFSLESVSGTLSLDHGGGALVMRDPPIEIRDLKVKARLQDGSIDIVDGTAEVNRGTVLLGGGWDPRSGQGVVFEIDDVTLFTEGILTKWDGDLVVEPRPGELAHVTGDLVLVAGLWDEAFDVTSAVFGAADAGLAADDPLHDVTLDISVRGRSGVKVDNNLGRFDVDWDVLRIDGTAATPRLHGTVRILPGGVIGIGGREIKVRRGTLDFTGDPAVDPIMEIVPESDMTLVGSGKDGTALDPTLIATRGLAQGISSVLGFENETLRPAEIAGQIERDPSVNFIVGQRLNRNLALFLSTNLTDVQDRLAMLQGWNFRALRGLVAQVYQETSNDNAGANLFQRFSWGGTAAGLERSEIYRLKLEGDWPMSKRRLKKATRLRRGQPFDPFLLFVASVRMERTLAQHGYQESRVSAFQEGEERAPTLVFSCEPGTPQYVRFKGGSLPKNLRGEVTSLYEPPPLETASLEEMGALVTRFLALQGFPDAEVSVERVDDLIVVESRRGVETEMRGPIFDGLPPEIAASLASQMGSATVVAALAQRPESLARSVEQRLATFGFLEAEVESVDIVHVDPSTAEVRIDVEAGPRETIDDIELVGSDPLGLIGHGEFGVRAGQPLDRETVDSAIRNLRNAYLGAGYREVSAQSEYRQTADDRWVVEIQLEPGNQRRLRNVRFSGLKHVSENVLEKGLEVEDGEILTDRDIDWSASQMANFSPIERVEVRTTDVGTSEIDVDFEVAEKDRWAAEVGGGWSTERGASASFGLRDDDLFGRGIGLNLRGGWGSTEKNIFLIGSVPPVPGGRLSLISTIGYQSGDAPENPEELAQEEELASLEAMYSLTSRVQVGAYYRWTNTRVYEKEPDPFDPFPFDSRDQLGTVGVRTIIDRFDNLFDPRRGWGLTSDLGWTAEAFGSDVNYLSWMNNFSLAVTPFAGATWLQTARVGVAEPLKGDNLIRSARFFAGGQASIRGFDLDSVGPVTLGFQGSLVPAGGGGLFVLNEELRIPVWGALRFAVFADIGQVWPSWRDADFNLAVGAGVGIRWSTPIGPLWADVAWPVADVGISSKKMKFYLGIGRPF